jgi:hypothetical protein
VRAPDGCGTPEYALTCCTESPCARAVLTLTTMPSRSRRTRHRQGHSLTMVEHAAVTSPRLNARAFSIVARCVTFPVSGRVPADRPGACAESTMTPFGIVRRLRPWDCGESWRRHGCASGSVVATVRPKQFPRPLRAFLADKFFGSPGPPRCFGRCAMRPARPPPIESPTRPR